MLTADAVVQNSLHGSLEQLRNGTGSTSRCRTDSNALPGMRKSRFKLAGVLALPRAQLPLSLMSWVCLIKSSLDPTCALTWTSLRPAHQMHLRLLVTAAQVREPAPPRAARALPPLPRADLGTRGSVGRTLNCEVPKTSSQKPKREGSAFASTSAGQRWAQPFPGIPGSWG